MKEVKITIKGTLVTLEYCSQKVMKELVKAGEYSNQTSAFEGEFYNGFYWTEVNELFVDGEETNNLIQNVGPIARTIDYFHNLFSDSHPLPVELHSKSQNGELDYIVEIEDNEEFEIKELQLIYSNELANTDVNQYGFPRYPQAILGSKILYKGKEVPVLEDDDFDDKIAIYSRDYEKEIINGWRPCFAIINGEANIPEGTEKIDRNAFRDCSDLTSIVIPNTVTFIWDCAFSGCPNLSSIVVSEGNKIYDSRDNCNAIIKTESNTLIAGCKNTVIPDSVTEIGSYAFDGRTGLTSIVISDSVTVIGSEAYNELIKDTNIVRSMSRAGKPTDNPVNEALNGWIKEELCVEFQIEQHWRSLDVFKQTIKRYVNYYNTQRPCFAIGYDTPENYRKRYYKGELPQKQTFESRILSPEPKFVQKRRQLPDNKDTYKDV